MKFKYHKIIGYLFQLYLSLSVIGFITYIAYITIEKQESKPKIVKVREVEKPLRSTDESQIIMPAPRDPSIIPEERPSIAVPEEVEEPSLIIPEERPSIATPEEIEKSSERILETSKETIQPIEPLIPEKKILVKNKKRTEAQRIEAEGMYYLKQYKPKMAQRYFSQLLKCDPESARYNYLSGVALSGTFQIDQAQKLLKKSVSLDPSLINAKIELGNVYTVQRKYKQAQSIFLKLPEEPYAQIGLGNLEYAKNKFCKSEKIFKDILQKHPCNFEARYGLAQSQASLLQYCKSRKILKKLVCEKPQLHYICPLLFDLEYALRPSVDLSYEYIVADDHLYRESATLDRYKIYRNNLYFQFPVTETYQLKVGGFDGYERYKRVQAPKSDLFLADILGFEIHNIKQFYPLWNIDIWGRYKRAISDGTMSFPFQSTTRIEPGIDLTYDSSTHYLDLKAYLDSFIILNFADTTSQLLTRDCFKGTYEYRFPFYTSSKIGAISEYTLYEDSLDNNQATETAYIRVGVPSYTEYFTIGYLFRYSQFKDVAQNYYSYDFERRHEFMVEFHPRWNSSTYFYLRYTRGWVRAKDVQLALPSALNPVPTPLVPKAVYNTHTIKATLTHRIATKAYFELVTSYYLASFPYKEARVYGKLIYLF